jgi:hypothetical protein
MQRMIAILLCFTLCACAAPRAVIEQQREAPQTVGLCQLADASNHFDGKRVEVEALVQVHDHGYFLSDSRCPKVFVILPNLTAARGYPCSKRTLAVVYGCPLRPARARFEGIYHATNSSLIVNEISDVRLTDQPW